MAQFTTIVIFRMAQLDVKKKKKKKIQHKSKELRDLRDLCNQGVSWSSSCDELKNFAVNIFLKLVSKPCTGIRTSNWLVTY